MYFQTEKNALIAQKGNETLRLEAWGKDALRVRATEYPAFTGNQWALSEPLEPQSALIAIDEAKGSATIQNGRLKVSINPSGVLRLFKDDQEVLREYYRNYDGSVTDESTCMKVINRDWKPIIGGDYGLTVRFNANDGEKFYGMGQYQQPYLDLKGCTLELAQRNSQVSIPFAVSSLGYGMLWNNPGVGTATFAKNKTEWHSEATKEMDYWFTVGDTPKQIVANYTAVTGRAPEMDSSLLGLWQCKLRYRTQDEVLDVARHYKQLGIPLDVIVIDFFHWTRQGDWQFDKDFWPDPKAMCDELHAMGTKVVVSVWPSVDRKSINFQEMLDKGYLIRTERGSIQTYDFQGDCLELDATNPAARQFVWEKCKKNYYDYGIDMFWLDNAEPDYAVYDYDNYRYYLGPAVAVTNIYPQLYAKAFHDGIAKEDPTKKQLALVRSAWAGSQKLGTLVWSGDVQSTFASLRDQLAAGLNMGLAGIPWWTTDVGGFMTDDWQDPDFKELLQRWFEFAVYSPVLRMHGDRGPHDIKPLSNHGGGSLYTGQSNELWSYGEDVYHVLHEQLKTRWALKPYLEQLYREASENGSPLLRTMFYEFPDDEKAWTLSDQYMFGSDYLVAPVLKLGQRQRDVYLPAGQWQNVDTGDVLEGGQNVTADAPLARIPVFKRVK